MLPSEPMALNMSSALKEAVRNDLTYFCSTESNAYVINTGGEIMGIREEKSYQTLSIYVTK
jgi:hypothetical protein